jgi:hypothetical protein
VPQQLPAGVAFFCGRQAEIKGLDELLGDLEDPGKSTDPGWADRPAGPVVITAIAGMPGVGKTALAVHWARTVAHRFPDGQLYANLRGYDADGSPVSPEQVTAWFLAALGVPAAQIPADPQERAGLYRTTLARRKMLILLDNAFDAAQVRPLLPGGSGCLAMLHDLLRAHAAEHASQELAGQEIDSAVARSLDHYLHSMVGLGSNWVQLALDPPRPGPISNRANNGGSFASAWIGSRRGGRSPLSTGGTGYPARQRLAVP